MALTFDKFTEEMSFYTLSIEADASSPWIVAKYEGEVILIKY